MFGWLFGNKKEVEQVKEDTIKGFESVKRHMGDISVWIKHLEEEDTDLKGNISDIKEVLSSIQNDLEGLKSVVGMIGSRAESIIEPTPKRLFRKRTAVASVQTAVQTAVQTPQFEDFSVTERALLWVLLNYDGSLSYEDLAVMLGKEKSTIRGQVNSLKSKSEGLIMERIEKNGKKRLYVPDEMKEKVLKKAKVGVNDGKRG